MNEVMCFHHKDKPTYSLTCTYRFLGCESTRSIVDKRVMSFDRPSALEACGGLLLTTDVRQGAETCPNVKRFSRISHGTCVGDMVTRAHQIKAQMLDCSCATQSPPRKVYQSWGNRVIGAVQNRQPTHTRQPKSCFKLQLRGASPVSFSHIKCYVRGQSCTTGYHAGGVCVHVLQILF